MSRAANLALLLFLFVNFATTVTEDQHNKFIQREVHRTLARFETAWRVLASRGIDQRAQDFLKFLPQTMRLFCEEVGLVTGCQLSSLFCTISPLSKSHETSISPFLPKYFLIAIYLDPISHLMGMEDFSKTTASDRSIHISTNDISYLKTLLEESAKMSDPMRHLARHRHYEKARMMVRNIGEIFVALSENAKQFFHDVLIESDKMIALFDHAHEIGYATAINALIVIYDKAFQIFRRLKPDVREELERVFPETTGFLNDENMHESIAKDVSSLFKVELNLGRLEAKNIDGVEKQNLTILKNDTSRNWTNDDIVIFKVADDSDVAKQVELRPPPDSGVVMIFNAVLLAVNGYFIYQIIQRVVQIY